MSNSKILALDTEITTHNKGHLHDSRNFLVCTSWACSDGTSGCTRGVAGIQDLVDKASLIIGFNWKFDLGWLKRMGVSFEGKRYYCGQLAEFILSRQTWAYPDLDTTAELRVGQRKIDVVKEEYWNKGINTDAVPWEILSAYAEQDAKLHLAVYEAQQALLTPMQKRLISQQCADLEILQEMEENGLYFNEDLCSTEAAKIDDKVSEITQQLSRVYGDVPINFNSGDHLSAFLYGGTIKEEVRTIIGIYKTGVKVGQPRFKVDERLHSLPRLVQPLRGSNLKKEGFYATNEDTLKKLKGAKKYIGWLMELSKLEKLNGTYFKGLPKLRNEMQWPIGILHGSLNQCVARTGRLSATRPNQQNFASSLQNIFISRYEE